MSLSIGIVGLPNVGKSTVFNALTRTQNAQVANYPFCTIEPNRAVVPVPDRRLGRLQALTGVGRQIPATVEFVDIAGLVAGASRGEGLGNRFLGNVRDADALVHVVRCFADPNVIHVREQPAPREDIEIIQTELALADLEQLERKIEKLQRQARADKKARPLLAEAESLRAHIGTGRAVAHYAGVDSEAFAALNGEMRFLTAKPVIYAANLDEDGLSGPNPIVDEAAAVAAEQGATLVRICARLEADLAELPAAERQEYLDLVGVRENGLDQIIRQSYRQLQRLSFFSFNEEEVRAWTVRQGATAPEAAGVIHTDFARGFIRAEVIHYDTFVAAGGWQAAREAGLLRMEGREYLVQDGDVIYFRFNV